MCKIRFYRYIDKRFPETSRPTPFLFTLQDSGDNRLSSMLDSIDYLFRKLYPDSNAITITNLRFLTLLQILDHVMVVQTGHPATVSGSWKLGHGSAYSTDILELLKKSGGYFEDEDTHRPEKEFSDVFEDIWTAKRRVIFDVRFSERRGIIQDETRTAINSVYGMARDVAWKRFNTKFTKNSNPDNKMLVDGPDCPNFFKIDEDLLGLAVHFGCCSEPEMEVGRDLDVVGSARRHRAAFPPPSSPPPTMVKVDETSVDDGGSQPVREKTCVLGTVSTVPCAAF